MSISCVWVEEGCIQCGACNATCPDVFGMGNDSSVIKAAVRQDGIQNTNQKERSPLKPPFDAKCERDIHSAAEGCPVSVIQFE